MINNDEYRLGVGIVLINDDNKIFIGQRIDNLPEAWQMPQGGVDEGETFEQAVLRELMEEVGTDKVLIVKQTKDMLYYDLPRELIGKVLEGKFKGQRQKWFLLKFLGDDNDINIATEIPEFREWRWEKPNVLPEIIVPFKKELYQKVLSEFGLI